MHGAYLWRNNEGDIYLARKGGRAYQVNIITFRALLKSGCIETEDGQPQMIHQAKYYQISEIGKQALEWAVTHGR